LTRPRRPSAETISAWQNRRFGLFIHWGLYSIPAGVWDGRRIYGYNEQIRAHARIPKEEYARLAEQFNPVLWDPDRVVSLAKAAGMKFIVITSKHHDGFSLFDTAESDFNVVRATPYGRDIVKSLADACARGGLGFGVYFSTIDWNFDGATPIDYEPDHGVRNDNEIPELHARFNAAQLRELLSNYGPISEVWFDMGKPTPDQSRLFADTVHALQPETMVSGRVFNYQGDFVVMGDNEIPPYQIDEPWQSPASIFHETWGYRSWQERTDVDGKVAEHLANLVRVVSRGGNYLLNIGPRGDGSIVEFEEEVLHGIGKWLAVNRVAIEGSEPQPFRHLDFGAATVIGSRVFLFVLDWPEAGLLKLPGLETEILSATWVGADHSFWVDNSSDGRGVLIGPTPFGEPIPVVQLEFASAPIVKQPTPEPNERGEVVLTLHGADTFYHRNGYGYSDPPELWKLRWWIEAAVDGPFEVSVECGAANGPAGGVVSVGSEEWPISVESGSSGPIRLGTVLLDKGRQVEVTVAPPEPVVKGTPLAIEFVCLMLSPLSM
jgi:alpha-L-fucosidase